MFEVYLQVFLYPIFFLVPNLPKWLVKGLFIANKNDVWSSVIECIKIFILSSIATKIFGCIAEKIHSFL
jgi:hypothetical protein